uniref:Uncharacterized protein n=1 Tax=viral metagenome TaxID=1070528 RepID=A0A6C0FAH6_9ZZZZ|tara:strand:- start:11589 stop:11750 length:162 start_codon:yes stop_codon:yes gene_type:complete
MSEKEEYQPWHMNSSLTIDKYVRKDTKLDKNEQSKRDKSDQVTKKRKLDIQSK